MFCENFEKLRLRVFRYIYQGIPFSRVPFDASSEKNSSNRDVRMIINHAIPIFQKNLHGKATTSDVYYNFLSFLLSCKIFYKILL